MNKKATQIPAEKLAAYEKLIATNPRIERKGVSMPYSSANGHVFTYLSKTGAMGLRLPKGEREAFLKKYKTTLYESHGAVMKEYVAVPDDLLGKTKVLLRYLEISFAYVKSLKPKQTKKKKS